MCLINDYVFFVGDILDIDVCVSIIRDIIVRCNIFVIGRDFCEWFLYC